MGAKVHIEFDHEAFHQIIESGAVRSVLMAQAGRIAAATGSGARSRVIEGGYGGGRPVAFVSVASGDPERFQRFVRALEGAVHG